MGISGVVRTVPRGHWLGVAAVIVASVGMFAPVLGAPATRILGNFQSEAATHAPALAAALEGLWRNGPFVLADHPLHPERVNGAMFEPITTLTMWPFYAALGGGEAGFAFAWNAWQLVTLLGGAVGAGVWARAWLGERDAEGWGAGLAAGLAAASAFVHLSPEVGRTEAQNYPLYALHGGLLFRAVRRGGRAWIGAALSVVPVVWAGGYAAVFFAVTEPLVALWALSIAADRRAVARGLAAVAATALVAVAPLAWALQAHPYVALDSRAGAMAGLSASLGALVGMAEHPLRELAGYEVAPYAGAATLIAAAVGAARWRGAAWPLGVALALYAVAAGPAPELGDRALVGPAAVLGALPGPFGDVRVWARIVAIAIPIFAVAGAAAAAGRGRASAAVATVLVLGALAEASHLRVGSTWSLAPDARVTALRAAGASPIPLPLDGIERTRRWLAPPALPDVWAAMPDHPLFRYLQDTLPNEPELFRATGGATGTFDPCALQADAVALRAKGFTHLVVRENDLPRDGAGMANRAVNAVFGAAKADGAWPLPERVSEACAAGGVEPIVLGRKDGRAPDAGPKSPEERAAIQAARRAERERVRRGRFEKQSEKLQRSD